MRVDLLLVFCLDDQDDLNGDQVKRVIALRKYKLGLSVNGKLSGVLKPNQGEVELLQQKALTHLENMSHGVLSINLLLHDTILVDTNCRENVQYGLVHLIKTIDN